MRPWISMLLGVALMAGACGDDAAPTTVVALPAVNQFRPFDLAPGHYRTSVMTPAVSLTIAQDGWLHLSEYEPLLVMSRTMGSTRQRDFLNFVTFPATDPDTVIATIRAVPGVEAGEPEATTVGGRDAKQFLATVAVAGGGAVEVFAFPNNALYNRVPLDPPRFADGDQIRFTAVAVGEDTVVILAGVDAGLDYGDFITQADEVLETVTFG